jgi:hypothetical protein
MKQDKLFSKLYIWDEFTNCYMIEIALDQYTDIFNEWDPAPFKRREIDPDLALYLEGCSEEISFPYRIELCFILPAKSRNELMEEEAREGLKNCFSFKIYFLKKNLKKINIRLLRYTFIGFVLLWVGITFPSNYSEAVWVTVLTEGIVIGGWVFLWEAVSLFFFTNREIYERLRMYKRLLNASVIFREADI